MKRETIVRNLLCLSAAIGLCQFGISLKAEEALIFPAGKFETANVPYGWQKWPRETSTNIEIISDGRNGSKAGRFNGDPACKDASLYTYVKLEANEKYHLEGYVRSGQVTPSLAKASVSLNFQKEAKRFSVKMPDTADTKGEWLKFELNFSSPSELLGPVQFVVSLDGLTGSIDLSGLKIEKIPGFVNIPLGQNSEVLPLSDYASLPEKGRICIDTVANGSFPKAKYPVYLWLSLSPSELTISMAATHEKGAKRAEKTLPKDSAVWSESDTLDIFVCPSGEFGLHYILSSSGSSYDGKTRISSFGDASGKKEDSSWNGNQEVEIKQLDNLWLARLRIPLKDLKEEYAGDVLRMNIMRINLTDSENLSLSPLLLMKGIFRPEVFSKLSLDSKTLSITEKEFAADAASATPFKIERPVKNLALPSDKRVYPPTFAYDIGGIKNLKKDKAHWLEVFRQESANGVFGHPLPWLLGIISEEDLNDLSKSGFRAYVYVDRWGVNDESIKNGGEPHPLAKNDSKNHQHVANPLHPTYTDAVIKEIQGLAKHYQGKNWAGYYFGVDEPHNNALVFWDRRLNGESPFFLETEANIAKWSNNPDFKFPDIYKPGDWDAKDRAFWSLAWQYWDKCFYEGRCKVNSALKEIDPETPYAPVNFNLISGISPADFTLYDKHCGDYIEGDPYASSIEREKGRGVYNHGFGTKLLVDLAKVPVVSVIQVFPYYGYTPSADDIWEWSEQALKSGAATLHFYDDFSKGAYYQTELEISAALGKIQKPVFPEPDCAIIDTYYERTGAKPWNNDSARKANELYSAYVLLGEGAGSWFKFISDTQIDRKELNLSSYKVIYLPLGRCLSEKTAEALRGYVEQGGILVLADPLAGTEPLYPAKSLPGIDALVPPGIRGAPLNCDSPISGVSPKGGKVTWDLTPGKPASVVRLIPPANTEVLLKDAQGAALAVKYPVAKGSVVLFSVNPFQLSSTYGTGGWNKFFKGFQDAAACKTSLPIWNFTLPRPSKNP